jgi:F-type H+-transporting ATPase subunit c
MKKIMNVAAVVLAISALMTVTSPAMAQVAGAGPVTPPAVPGVASPLTGKGFGSGIGAGLVMIGAAMGFGKIGAAALESMARQPEVANKIQTAMIIIAALLEGATFFALIVCISIPSSW